MGLISTIFSSDNTRHVKKLRKTADKVIALADEYRNKTDDELRACTPAFRARIAAGESLDSLLPHAFAVVREAATRVLKQTPFYVQILGAIALHQGRIAEMKTGEGKTITSTMPVYLNALAGKGVHVVEVNEYLAKRNAEWMGKVHRFLGLTVGLSRAQADPREKQAAYNCDITYVTSSEIGFDYLRDNVAHSREDRVLRGNNFAIIDEVDSILIDESRTPLIMSSRTKDNSDQYKIVDRFVRVLRDEDYEVDLKEKAVRLTESGIEKAERNFGIDNIADADSMELNHFINNALRAHFLFERDSEYIVNADKEVVIVDQYTGRTMAGRRYSDGLHQAIEAKEGVAIKNEDKTVATITIQNLFKLYNKLSGMTGTAKTEENEFQKIYGVDVVTIPTNNPVQRQDTADVVFTTLERKYEAILADVDFRYQRGQPVLIGTSTIDKSEDISKLLKTKKIPHVILNAKHHEQEGEIVAQAGKVGAITIATNMAGRGTDILLGGNPEHLAKTQMKRDGLEDEQIANATSFHETTDTEILELRKKFQELYKKHKLQTDEEKEKVIELGGLHIIGTERHDSRRIDNQLRGRAGRQGDPGSTIFYISCEDEIMKRFGKDIVGNIFKFFRMDDVQSRVLTRLFERVQRRVEGYYFDARRHTFEFDNVMNDQRMLIYKERNQILDGEDVHKQILAMFPDVIGKIVAEAIDMDKLYTEWDLKRANEVLGNRLFGKDVDYLDEENTTDATSDEIEAMVRDAVLEQYKEKVDTLVAQGFNFAQLERDVLLSVVDQKWMNHIDAMVQLRNGIGLRGYGQKNPVIEYRRESREMFIHMTESIAEQAALFLFKIQIEKIQEKKIPIRKINVAPGMAKGPALPGEPVAPLAKPTAGTTGSYTNIGREIGRNDPCPCGSGKKFKSCCAD
jgi:preprotein translocase subunit SecA